MKPFKAIAAMSLNRVIGKGNQLPWHLPGDLKWFKQLTTGNVVIMGRKTFESIGRPLPNRETIVLSRGTFSHPGVKVLPSLESIVRGDDHRDYFICGGAQVYAQALPLCTELFLTRVLREVEGDAFFPEFESGFKLMETLASGPEFEVQRWVSR